MTQAMIMIGAYLLGGIPFGYLLVRCKTGQDVRAMGSGNIGATNVLRTTGRIAGIVTLLLDIAKGYLAVFLAGRLTGNDPLWTSAAAVAVLLGHAFPVFLKFRGGKAVASFIGAFLCLTPAPLLAAVGVFVAAVALSRYISLGSILAAGCFPIAVWWISHPPPAVLAAAAFSGVFIIWRHRSNIRRLCARSEHRFSFGGRAQ
ncbi:MAG: glycerol-3-phosphate 1-O-acyltransferase PlsY [Acidobacteria bacterium]|nr:glycerol-3-phosphate 1-O-acyltransferase PlsY [Acidobacteriota bacterium]